MTIIPLTEHRIAKAMLVVSGLIFTGLMVLTFAGIALIIANGGVA